jgi:tetratricopeptide (TPR) repeat protein
MKLFLIILISFSILSVYAQTDTDSQLAHQYYRDKDYEKAADLFERLYRTNRSRTYLTYLVNCLVELNRTEEAIKIIKKQIKWSPDELSYLVDLGYLYHKNGETEKGSEQYDKAIKKLQPHQTYIRNLANTFTSYREYDYAEKVYQHGKKILKGNYTFDYELAFIYRLQRDFQNMIDAYLNLLEKHESYIQSVQNSLQSTIYNEDDEDLTSMLKNSLIRKIQKHPNKTIFSELLIWLYIQDKDYEGAYYQTKALDKRNYEQGKRLIALGELAVSSNDFNAAVKCFKYVIDYGPQGIYYIDAKNKYLNTLYQKILVNSQYSNEEVIELEKSYQDALNELGKSNNTFDLIIEYAHLKAFYLYELDSAINILNHALSIANINSKQISKCKLELGDILLFSGDPWEASLLYAQVEKSNEHNPIGHEAKFRKAKLAYYTGNFRWAEAQLDVLKASTSKLIANDAFELSSLINDNTAIDTIEAPLKLYAKSDFLLYQNKDSVALATLDSINILYPGHSLADDILYKKAIISSKRGDYNQAISYYQLIIDNHYYDILADNALFRIAELYEFKIGDTDKAMEYYKKLMFDFPGSIYIVDSRKRFRTLRGDHQESKEDAFFKGLEPNG